MKKLVIIIIFSFLITSCGQKINIEDEIININYESHTIKSNDYSSILTKLQNINFYCGKQKQFSEKKLSISTNKTIINFTLSNNYYMEYQKDNEYCYTKASEKVKDLVFLLEGIIKRYTRNDFYTIEHVINYEEKKDETNVRLDKSNEYVLIRFNEPVTNFKINEIEFQEDGYEDINLIYENDTINNVVAIRKSIIEIPKYRISFSNKYGYSFYIMPIYDGITNKVKFEIETK